MTLLTDYWYLLKSQVVFVGLVTSMFSFNSIWDVDTTCNLCIVIFSSSPVNLRGQSRRTRLEMDRDNDVRIHLCCLSICTYTLLLQPVQWAAGGAEHCTETDSHSALLWEQKHDQVIASHMKTCSSQSVNHSWNSRWTRAAFNWVRESTGINPS